MATDLETQTEGGELAMPRPSLKITGLHIRGLKSLKTLDLPEDGLGWNGEIPDFVMVGGINGSGKTTLLEFLASVFVLLGRLDAPPKLVPPMLRAVEARIDLRISMPEMPDVSVRFLVGDDKFMVSNAGDTWFGFIYSSPENELSWVHSSGKTYQVACLNELARGLGEEDLPAVVYFPSEGRTLISPETNYKFAGKTARNDSFVMRWKPPDRWDNSLESRLYGVRWEDLNAKEEGREREANGFAAYSKAFDRFFEGRKRLKWDHGELVVETKSGAIHGLSELSSGEKQVILFMGELLHRWRPGSVILIDEPELHLHESYQTKLWESLVHWQKERGGQVIVATQSGHLFRISEPGIKVLLSRQSL